MKYYFEAKERQEALVSEALSWLGTPFILNSRVKGTGVSCHNLVIGVWGNVGVKLDFESPKGSGKVGDQTRLKAISNFMADKSQFDRIDMKEDSLMVGDLVSFKTTTGEYHCGLFLGEVDGQKDVVMQVLKPMGCFLSNLGDSTFFKRLSGAWRLKHG